MRGQRRDANEDEIIEALELAGYRVSQHYTPDPFDLAVARLWSPVWLHLEVKTPTGKLKPSQEAELKMHGIVVVRSVDEALAAAKEYL